MKANNQWFKNRYFSLFSLFIIISLLGQLIGPQPVDVTASTNQPNQTEMVTIGNQKSNNDQLRPSLQSKTPNIGKRHSFSEPHYLVDVFQDTDFITQKLIPFQSDKKIYSTFLFVENMGQFDSKQAFELRQNSSISRFTDDSIWFSLLEPQNSQMEDGELSISVDGLPLDQANGTENTQKGVNIQVKFIGSENKPTIEGFNRSESKISYFYGNDENSWHPDVPVWNGIRYVDLYPGVNLEVSGIDGSWSWTLVVKDSIQLVDWINKSKGNDIHFHINGTKSNRYSNKNLQLSSVIGELYLPDIKIIWEDGNPLGIEEQSPLLDGKELVLISNNQFAQFLSTPTPTSEPTSTETLLPTNTIVTETPTFQPTVSESLSPTGTETLVEKTPTLEPTSTDTSLPIETILVETPTLEPNTTETQFPIETEILVEATPTPEPTATETHLPTETEIPTGEPTINGPTITETPIPTPSETPTEMAIVIGTPTTVIPSTETPNPTVTIIPTEETSPSPETTPIFDQTYTWNFTNDVIVEQSSIMSQSIQGRIYATYLSGPSGVRDTYIDPEGFVYIVGDGNSPGFPTTPGAFKQTSTGTFEGFVSKINPEGSALVYSTFLGGSTDEQVLGIAVDNSGLAYVGGWTSSTNFPTTPGVFQTQNVNSTYDGFITKLNNDGTGLIYSTYLGGSTSGDQVWDLTIDSDGHAYVVGMSSGIGFPTTLGAYDTVSTDGYEGFVTKLSSNASTLLFSTFLGGSGAECAQAYEKKDCSIFIDFSRNVYVVGNTWSSDFPTTSNAYDQTYNGNIDAFFSKLNSTGSNLLYSTYLGGSSTESYGTFLGAIDSFGAVYIAGTTSSADFPITSGNYHGGRDVFVTKLFPDSRGVIYSTLVGGTNNDIVRALDITPNGDVYIAGETYSSNYPVSQNAFQPSLRGVKDAFLTKIGPDGSTIQYSTYLGGSSGDVGFAASRSDNTSVSIAGHTSSNDFPTTAGSFQPTGPGNESFVAVFSLETQVQDNNTNSSCGPSKTTGTSLSDFRECPTTQETQGSAGDPINTRTGSFDVSFSDISIPTVAGNLVFQRYYSSGTIYLSTQPLGPGWTHNQDTRLIFPSDPGGNPDGILFKAHSLNTYLFLDNGDGTFSPEAGLTSNLVMQVGPPITYTITDQSQHVYTFDEYGKLTLWEDGKGHSWSYSYDINDRLYRVTDTTSSNFLELSYSTGGYLTSVTDSLGRSVTYDYDTSNDLVLVTDVSTQEWVLTYDSNHRFRILSDPNNKTIIHTEYDSQGRAYQQFDGDSNLILEIAFNADGSRVITDGEGNDITHLYSTRNTLYLDRNSLDNTKLMAYDDNFRLVSQTDENSNALALNWSSDGANLLKMTDAGGNETDLFYDPLNNLESITLPSGVSNDYGYSGTLLTSSSDGLNQTTYFTYTDLSDAPAPVGFLKTIEDPLNHFTQFEYNSLGQLTHKINALNLETQFLYDSWGNQKATIYPSGRQDWTCYNSSGKLVKTISNASGGLDNWTFEPCSEQYIPITDPSLDRTIQYFHDASGNLFASIGEDGKISRTYFDQNNRIATSVENLVGQSMENSIPPSFNPSYPDRNIRTDYAYDNNGNLIATTDTLGIITRTYFDSENRPEFKVQNLSGQGISVSTPPSFNPFYPNENIITQMVYDPAGNLIASIDTYGIITRTYFDQVNRPVSVVRNLTGQSISISTPPSFNANYPDQNVRTDTVYDASGNVIATIDTLGRITRTYFTALDQPETIIQNLVGQSIYAETPPTYNPAYPDQNLRSDFYYDAVGNQIALIDPNGVITRTFYDAVNRPTVVVKNLQGQSIEGIYPPTYNPLYPDQNGRSETIYDVDGLVIASIDPNEVISRIYLDGLGRTSSVVRNLTGQSIESPIPPTYNPLYTDQNVRSDVLYDTWGNSIAQTFNDGRISRAYYYGGHRIVGLVENLSNWWVGNLFMPPYDPNYPDQNVRTLTSYDGLGNVVSITDPNGKVTISCYDDIGRIIKTVQNPSIGTPCVEYTPSAQSDQDIIQKNVYDALSNLTQSRDPLGKLTSYAYDDLGRLLSVTDPLLHQTGYTYDGLGNQVFKTDAENVVTKYEYNANNRLTAVVDNYISGTPEDAQTNVRTEYTYDANGNLLSIKNARNQYTYFTYDALNR